MRNFNETFPKDVTYDKIKSDKKTGHHPLSLKSRVNIYVTHYVLLLY